MRLWAASRPVSIFPLSSKVSPGFQLATSALLKVSRFTRLLFCASGAQATSGQRSRLGGSRYTGPEPSSTKWAWRVAAQLGIMATGLLAAWVGYILILTSSTVVRPPKPCAPMPKALTFSYNSRRRFSTWVSLSVPLEDFSSSWYMSKSSMRLSLAMSTAFSAVPPMPIPSMPGGHQPAPMVGTVLSTQSTTESLGLSMTILLLFSLPPPLAATVTSRVLPGTSSVKMTAGVLSPVFLRANCGSLTTEARSMLSGRL